MTNNLVRRIYLHREGLVPGFTKQYGVKLLVYYEQHATALAAIQLEKNVKHWPRTWKIDLVISMNPDWYDLYDGIARWASPQIRLRRADDTQHGCAVKPAHDEPR